jgi:hypothetical protein
MLRVDQAVVLIWSKGGRHQQQAVFTSLSELVSDSGKCGRGCRAAPIRGQPTDFDAFQAYVVRHLGQGQHEIGGRVVLVEMNEVFQQGKRLVLRRIAEADARA